MTLTMIMRKSRRGKDLLPIYVTPHDMLTCTLASLQFLSDMMQFNLAKEVSLDGSYVFSNGRRMMLMRQREIQEC